MKLDLLPLMLRRYSRVVKAAGGFIISSGGLWIFYQFYTTSKKFNGLLGVNVLDYEKKKAEYIYLDEAVNSHKYESINDAHTSFISSAIFRWWTAFQKAVAWRLMYLARSGTRWERQKAVRDLAKLTILTDPDYHMLAQACDSQTAVGLARTEGCNLRFFLPPPKVFLRPLHGKELKEKLVELLQGLETKNHHSCIENFLLTCEDSHEDSPGVSFSPFLEEEIITKALDILVHHCSIGTNAKDLLHLGALPVLMELLHYLQTTSPKRLTELFSILSYLSVFPQVLPAFYMSGWIGVLAKWSRHSDADLSLPCAKTLTNLDCDSPDSFTYPERIFPLFPVMRNYSNFKADVIFVHGLLGTVYVTWRQRDPEEVELSIDESSSELPSWFTSWFTNNLDRKWSGKIDSKNDGTPETSHRKTQLYMDQLLDLKKEDFEMVGSDFDYVLSDLPIAAVRSRSGPFSLDGKNAWVRQLYKQPQQYSKCWARDWLPNDCPNVRILGINYTSSLSQWFPICSNKSASSRMADKSIDLMKMLHEVGVGDRPIIWVTHSMGGLLVKHMLTAAYESGDKELLTLYRNTKAVVFFSCPHMGSEVADLKMPTEMLFWPSLEVQELRYRSPALVNLHLKFLQLLKVAPMEILSFVETKSTSVTAVKLPISFVHPLSADPGVGEFYEIPLDHISICKPAGRYSFLYRKIVDIINRVLPT